MNILIIVLVIISIFFLFYTHKKNNEGFKQKKRYLDGVDVIYWINLDRSTDRRQRMEQMFKDPVFRGKKIVRVSAVDGKAPDIDQILKANFEGMQPDKFTKVEYACTLSHLNAIKQFSESNDEVALIMEDDMTLEYKPYWRRSVKQIMDNAPNDWEIIQLCINTQKPLAKIYTRNEGNSQIFGTVAYIINKKCTDHFKNHRLLTFSEHTADKYLYNKCVTYAYKYPMFTYNFNETSTIHQDHINDHNRSKKIIDSFIQSSRSR